MKLRDSSFSDFSAELEDLEIKKTSSLVTRIYSASPGGSIHCMPAVKDGVVYFCSMDNYVYALDCRTGKVAWKLKTDGQMAGNSPEIIGDTMYIGNLAGSMYALDIKTGRIIWRSKVSESASTKTIFYKKRLYYASLDGNFYCLDSEGGRELWRFRTGGPVFYAPSCWEGKIYFGSGDGNFYCINAESGKEVWRFKTGDEVYSEAPSEVHDGIIYFASLDNNIYAVNARTGKEMWRFKTGMYGNCFSPVVHDGIIYHGSRDGILYALTLEGKELWRFRAEGLIGVKLLADGNRLYFGSEDTNLYCLDAKTGKEIWRFKTSGPVWSPPSLWKASLFFGSWDCHLYCLDIDGKEKWRFATSDKTICRVDPPYKVFEMVVKKAMDEDSEADEKYDLDFSGMGSGNVYNIESEYVVETTYATGKDYGE